MPELNIYQTGKIILEGIFKNKTTIATSEHKLRIVLHEGIKYYFFTHIEGTSAMNWTSYDYEEIKDTFNLKEEDRIVYRNNSNDMFVGVSSSYRTN